MARLHRNSFVSAFHQNGAKNIRHPARPVAGAFAPAGAPTPPTPPSAAGPAPLPVDPAYDQTIAGLGLKKDTTIQGLDQQRLGGLSDYGYSATFDPNGNVVGIARDPNNPYSQSALMKKHFDQQRTGNTNSYAARGQLYAGSLQNAQNATTDNYNQADNGLQRSVMAFLARNQQQRGQASVDYELGSGQALGDSVARGSTNPLYDPTTAPGAAKPAVAPVAALVPKKKPKVKAVSTKFIAGRNPNYLR
jgi:hypothetical protein